MPQYIALILAKASQDPWTDTMPVLNWDCRNQVKNLDDQFLPKTAFSDPRLIWGFFHHFEIGISSHVKLRFWDFQTPPPFQHEVAYNFDVSLLKFDHTSCFSYNIRKKS